MILRKYENSDLIPIVKLFKDTVYAVNSRDYTREQIDAWAGGKIDLDSWQSSLSAHNTIVAAEGNFIVGFGDAAKDGYLDRLYVHKDFQRRSVATKICDMLEKLSNSEYMYTHASITARAFFEKRGYSLKEERQVLRQGISLKNYLMEKPLKKNSIKVAATQFMLN